MESQKVKLQISSDLEDVTRISAITLEDALNNLSRLNSLVEHLKKTLSDLDITEPQHREVLKNLLLGFDTGRVYLTKIDMRLGDVSSIVSGLNSMFEPKQEEQKEENDVNINAG